MTKYLRTAASMACGILAVLALACGGGPKGPTDPGQPGPPPTTMPPPVETTLTDISITPASGSTIPFSQGSGARIGVSGKYTVGPNDIAPAYIVGAYTASDPAHPGGGSQGQVYTATSGAFSTSVFRPRPEGVPDGFTAQTHFMVVRLVKLQGEVAIKEVVIPWEFTFQ